MAEVRKAVARLDERQAEIRTRQRDRLDQIHALCHEFMRDFDRAVLIHEVKAVLEGRDPTAVNSALWPVRTVHPARETKR